MASKAVIRFILSEKKSSETFQKKALVNGHLVSTQMFPRLQGLCFVKFTTNLFTNNCADPNKIFFKNYQKQILQMIFVKKAVFRNSGREKFVAHIFDEKILLLKVG